MALLERGIITGCTISATLFALAMNMLIKAAEVECRGPTTKSGQRQPPIRAYMDDMTITTTSVIGAWWLLRGIENLILWTRMSFNARKSRSLVLKKEKIIKERFKLSGEFIPTIKQNPVKSLGKRFDDSLKDTAAIQETKENLERWLNKIERSGLPGRFKAWIYQNAVLPNVLWQLTIDEFTSSSVEQLEKRINSRLCRWLGLPKWLSSAALNGDSNALQLPFKSLVEEYEVTKVRTSIEFMFSKDPKVTGAGVEVDTGKKWKATKEVKIGEERLREK